MICDGFESTSQTVGGWVVCGISEASNSRSGGNLVVSFSLRVSAKNTAESKSATQMPKAFRRVCATGSGTNLAASDE